jgi:hypothetical protein
MVLFGRPIDRLIGRASWISLRGRWQDPLAVTRIGVMRVRIRGRDFDLVDPATSMPRRIL